MNDPSNQQQQQFSLQQSLFHTNGSGGMGIMNPQHQQANQLSTAHFATSSSTTAGNGGFNTAGSQSQINQNFINMQASFGQAQKMPSFLDGNVQEQNNNNNMQHINSFALSQNQGPNLPNQFAPHLFQNQTQLLSVHNQFRQDNVNDWRNTLSFQDRNHVVRQFGVAVQNALPPPHQNATKVDNLAKGLEQHIYESAESRANYMEKIKDQLNNIERKASEVRNSNTPAVEISQPQNQTNPQSVGLLTNNSAFSSTPGGLQSNQYSITNEKMSGIGNSLGLDVTGIQNPIPTENLSNQNMTSMIANINGNNLSNISNSSSELKFEAAGTADSFNSGNNLDYLSSGDANGQLSKVDENLNQVNTFGESQVNGMKVTLLDLQESEKDAVRTKMEQIRPTYLRIDALISTLLKHGGDREFDKVRKLTGMKQMLQAQYEVLHQNIFFIRPETLQQLLPSLNQYFGYAELIGNRNGGNTPILRGNQPSPSILGQVNSQQTRSQSPMIHSNVGNAQNNFGRQGATSPSMNTSVINNTSIIKPNMVIQQPMVNIQPSMPSPQQIQQHIQIVQTKIMHLQQQLQQVHQMATGPIGPDQLQNIQMRQQDLLRTQQLMNHQLNQLNQMHRLSLGQQRTMNMTPRPNLNQLQNPLASNQIRHINPQAFPQRTQQMPIQQYNVFQGQPRQLLQTAMQQGSFQPVPNSFSQVSNLGRVLTPSTHTSDYQNSPSGTSPQVSTPQAANSPADTTASAQVRSKTPPKQSSNDNSNVDPSPKQVENQIFTSTSSNQSSIHDSPGQTLYISTPAGNQNQSISSLNFQPHNGQSEIPSNTPPLTKAESMDTKKAVKQNNEGQWNDDPFNFGVDPLSAGPVVENKDEENVEDFFNWDYEPPGKSANQQDEDHLEFLEPETESHEASPVTLEGEAPLSENSVGPLNSHKRRREDDIVQQQSDKKKKDFQIDLEEEISQLETDFSISCNILPNTPSSHVDHCTISFTYGSISFDITLIGKSAYESGNFSIEKRFSSTHIPNTLIADLLKPSSQSRLVDFIERIVQN